MKVSPVNSRIRQQKASVVKKSSGQDFSNSMNLAYKEHAEKELQQMLKKISDLGDEIKEKPTSQRINDYKRQIKDYLSYVLKHYYKLSPNYSRFSAQLLLRVEVINKKIEDLTSDFIKQQKDNIDFIDKIDEIQGLLVDLYN